MAAQLSSSGRKSRAKEQRRKAENGLRQARMTQAILAEFSDEDSVVAQPIVSSGVWTADCLPEGADDVDDDSRGPFHVVLAVDASGSMRRSDVLAGPGDERVRRTDAVIEALDTFIASRQGPAGGDVYSLVTFNRTSTVHFVEEVAPVARKHLRETAERVEPQSLTNYVAGLKGVASIFESHQWHSSSASRAVVFLSDGQPGDAAPMLEYFQRVFCGPGCPEFHTVGFGDFDDFAYLQQLSALSRGTFQLAGRSTTALRLAMGTVSASVTRVAASDLSDRRSCAFERPRRIQDLFVSKGAVTFACSRQSYRFDGQRFELAESATDVRVRCRPNPWTQGCTHVIYGMQDSSLTFYDPSRKRLSLTHMVAKVAREGCDAKCYAENVAVASWCAKQFRNRVGVPALFFVPCYQYILSGGAPMKTRGGEETSTLHTFSEFVAERHVHGVFTKYNNNKGYVQGGSEQSIIAQAFSHFSFEVTGGEMLVVDIQGVVVQRDHESQCTDGLQSFLMLSDPQVLSRTGRFGRGDLGLSGFEQFFRTHRCNALCKHLGLRSASTESCGAAAKSWYEVSDDQWRGAWTPTVSRAASECSGREEEPLPCTQYAHFPDDSRANPGSVGSIAFQIVSGQFTTSNGNVSRSEVAVGMLPCPATSGIGPNLERAELESQTATPSEGTVSGLGVAPRHRAAGRAADAAALSSAELLLEQEGRGELADRLLVRTAVSTRMRRAAAELYRMHFCRGAEHSQAEAKVKFFRRLALLLEDPYPLGVSATTSGATRSCTASFISDASGADTGKEDQA